LDRVARVGGNIRHAGAGLGEILQINRARCHGQSHRLAVTLGGDFGRTFSTPILHQY
jgi:hypothetical protein